MVETSHHVLVKIALLVEAETGVPLWQLQGYDRHHTLVWIRQGVMLIMSQAGFSASAIGRFLKRNHATVLHGVEEAKKREGSHELPIRRTLAALKRASDVAALGELHADQFQIRAGRNHG